jgi:2-haloacid dehalogenase
MTVAPKHGESHSNPGDRRTNAQWIGGKPSVLIFDVNETLIDFGSMSPLFKRVFGDERVLREWLGHLFLYSMTITLSGLYKDFFSLGQGLFEMVGAIHKVKVGPADVEALKEGMLTMPAHADVKKGLKQLKDAGFRMVTLTNSPPNKGGKTPVENAGLAEFFERQFSVAAARAYKPAQLLYHMVAQELEVPPSACCMVAAHVWDTIGAQSAGLAAGLLTRPGNAPLPVPGLPQPNVVAPDLPALAAQMIKLWLS